MTWGTPPVFADGNLLTAAQLNTISNDLLETAAAKATTAGYHFAATGVNSVAQRAIEQDEVATQETTTSTSYVSLGTTGPQVTVTTGPRALVWISAQLGNSTTGQSYMSYEVGLASSVPGSDSYSLCIDGGSGALHRYGMADLRGCVSGSNRFLAVYRTNVGTATFLRRRLGVMAL